MGRVEPERGDGSAAAKHDVRGMRIGEDIVLGRRRAVPRFPHRAAHHDDLGHLVQDPGVLPHRRGDVRERPRRHQRHGRVVGCEQRLHDEVDGMLGAALDRGLHELETIQAPTDGTFVRMTTFPSVASGERVITLGM